MPYWNAEFAKPGETMPSDGEKSLIVSILSLGYVPDSASRRNRHATDTVTEPSLVLLQLVKSQTG